MHRRDFMLRGIGAAGLAWALGAPSRAQASTDRAVYVLKCMLFTCPVCRAAEAIDESIANAARLTGGNLIQAPLPVDDDFSSRIYYALRTLPGGVERRVRNSLYTANQDRGIAMSDPLRAMVWLQQDLPDLDIDWSTLHDKLVSPEVTGALTRAANIAVSMGVVNTPSYVLVAGGRPVAIFDPSSVTPQNSLSALRSAVVQGIEENQPKAAQ